MASKNNALQKPVNIRLGIFRLHSHENQKARGNA